MLLRFASNFRQSSMAFLTVGFLSKLRVFLAFPSQITLPFPEQPDNRIIQNNR